MNMYPELERICFYCSNSTLPRDDYYFYSSDELNAQLMAKLEEPGLKTAIAPNTKNTDTILMGSKLNYFSSETTRNYVEFQISRNSIQNILYTDRSDRAVLLVDSYGNLMTDSSLLSRYQKVQDLFPEMDAMKYDAIENLKGTNGKRYLCKKTGIGNDLTLIMLVDEASVFYAARIMPLRMISVYIVILGLLALFAFVQSRYLNQRLSRILLHIDDIGKGQFDRRLESDWEDELGQIEREVDHMSGRIQSLIRENYEKQLIIKSTELNLLQEQINPHFLYNALAVISSLSLRENGKATVQSIRNLANFYRISLNKGRKVITVKEEMELLSNYMKIQMLRFSDYVEIEYELEAGIEDYYMIKLLLQPLVENAIHHAREEELFLTIQVKAYGKADRICFDVDDNGTGIPEDKLKKLQMELQCQAEGFGLKNVDKRIKLAYGQEYGISIFSRSGQGTRIHIEIPKVSENREGKEH